MLSHRYAVRTAENMIEPFRLNASDVNYTPYPLSHIGPAYYDILSSLISGGQSIIRDGFSLSSFWSEVARYRVTWFMCLGSVQQLLYAAPPCDDENNHCVSRCWATPAPVPKEDFEQRFGLHLIPGGGYGSTDAGWVVAPQWDHPGGKVLPQFEIAIVDEHDDPVPAGHDGQLLVRPREPGVMSDGYFGMPDKTLESRRNLWFHTGDIGCIDNDGLFYFRCRMAERIRVKGEMINGFEVEEGALLHPAVEDAAAIGVPAAHGEEEVHLYVTLKAGALLTADKLQQHCRQTMAKFMVPAAITILQEMPRTPTGKPEKGRLRELYMQSK
jgi:crotonobetaine/carnitine-CoA ligase